MFFFALNGGGSSSLYPVNTPILYEGDSNTDWFYQTNGWAKRALVNAGGRYYIPSGGDFAVAGSTVESMVQRQAGVVTKIQSMVSKFGRCIVWFQIGTNGGTIPTDINRLISIVAAYRSAGAKVYANCCPVFNGLPNGYIDPINDWIKTTGNVDGFVDVNTLMSPSWTSDGTHYNDLSNNIVGGMVGSYLNGLMVTGDIYAANGVGFVDGSFSGSVTAPNPNVTGQLATGWNLYLQSGSGTVIASKTTLGGKNAQQMVFTGATSGDTTYVFTRSDALTFATGDAIDGFATVFFSNIQDASTVVTHSYTVGVGSEFPLSFGAPIISTALYTNAPQILRTYPSPRLTSGSSVASEFRITIAANKTATVIIADARGYLKESGAYILPRNSVPPSIPARGVGQQPTLTSNGVWSAIPTATFTPQYVLGGVNISPSYTFVGGDIGKQLYCDLTASNIGGSIFARSNTVTITA